MLQFLSKNHGQVHLQLLPIRYHKVFTFSTSYSNIVHVLVYVVNVYTVYMIAINLVHLVHVVDTNAVYVMVTKEQYVVVMTYHRSLVTFILCKGKGIRVGQYLYGAKGMGCWLIFMLCDRYRN